MGLPLHADVVSGDRSPTASAGTTQPLTQTPEGRLRVDASLSVSDVEVTITEYTEDAAAAANPIGPVILAVRRDTLTTSEVSADGDNIAAKATSKGQLHVYAADLAPIATPPSTGTITSVNDTNASATILAANTARKGATVFNDSDQILYLALSDVTASSTVYSVKVAAGGLYELPFSQGGVYTGIIKGIWAADSTGAARVTELT